MLAEIFGVDGLVLLLVLVALVGGAFLVPKLARGIGAAKGSFKAGMQEGAEASAVLPSALPAAPPDTTSH